MAYRLAGAVTLLAAVSAYAQPTADPKRVTVTPAQVVQADCELHIWPSTDITFQGQGIFSSFGPGLISGFDEDGHAKGNARGVEILKGPLGPRGQLDQLKALDWSAILKRANVAVIEHEAPLEHSQLRDKKGRHSSSTTACYHELAVEKINVVRKTIYPPLMMVTFVSRNYTAKPPGAVQRSAMRSHYLRKFPKTGRDPVAADQEMRDIFKLETEEFVAPKG